MQSCSDAVMQSCNDAMMRAGTYKASSGAAAAIHAGGRRRALKRPGRVRQQPVCRVCGGDGAHIGGMLVAGLPPLTAAHALGVL